MNERRYRQRGYQDTGRGDAGAKPERSGSPGPPGGAVLGPLSMWRCAECGTRLAPGAGPTGACPTCGAALRACRQCGHFDPGRRFECARPIPERIADKAGANDCPEFTRRVTVERDASPSSVRPADARRALDDLFRKPPR